MEKINTVEFRICWFIICSFIYSQSGYVTEAVNAMRENRDLVFL